MDGELEKHLGESFEVHSSGNSHRGIRGFGLEQFDEVAYKWEFSFLRNGFRDCHLLKTDNTVLPEAILFCHKGSHFIARGIDPDATLSKNTLALNRIHEKNFLHCSVDPIIGYLSDSDGGNYDLMVHNFSGGIELASISRRAPPQLRADLSALSARTFAELHNQKIIYSDPVPTNMRYDFRDKILLNPHQHIDMNTASERGRTRDLALFIKTNNWLPSKEIFLREYDTAKRVSHGWKSLNLSVNDYLEQTDFKTELEPGIAAHWTQE